MIITKEGEVEVFSGSRQCSKAVATSIAFAGIGRTASLLDEELILLGNDDLGTQEGRYVSIQKPREGLLAMKYTFEDIPLKGSPHQHTSLVSKNTLAVIGGKFKSKAKLSKYTWTELSLHWKDGSKFDLDLIGSCVVKLSVDVHIIFGGVRKIEGRKRTGKEVVKIDTTKELAFEMKGMQHERAFHGCQLLDSSLVLLSGGLAQSEIQPDELYDIKSQESQESQETVLNLDDSLKRHHHSLIKIGERVFGVGGVDSDKNTPSKIEEFNRATNTWTVLNQELHSSHTSDLVVSPFPMSAIDCVPKCQCGIGKRETRIFDGSEAEVRVFVLNHP